VILSICYPDPFEKKTGEKLAKQPSRQAAEGEKRFLSVFLLKIND